MVGTNPALSLQIPKPRPPEFFVSSQAAWSRPVLAAGRLFARGVPVVRIGAGNIFRELTGVGFGTKIDEAVEELSGRNWRETRHRVSAFIRALLALTCRSGAEPRTVNFEKLGFVAI